MIHRLLHLLGVTFPGSLVVGTYPGDRRTAAGLRCHKCGRVTHAIWIDGGRYVDEPQTLNWEIDRL